MTEMQLPSQDAFLDQIMRAIVSQFFENPNIDIITDPTTGRSYIPQRSNPVQQVAARMLVEKQGELLKKILDGLDLNVVADFAAKEVLTILTHPTDPRARAWDKPHQQQAQDDLKAKIDSRLVELMAQRMLEDIQTPALGAGSSADVGTKTSRFERLREQHIQALHVHGKSDWIALGNKRGLDGETIITVLKNPQTGEVVSDQGWE